MGITDDENNNNNKNDKDNGRTENNVIEENEMIIDNPCWGSPTQCSLIHLTKLISKQSAILHECNNYIVLNKPPDLRMDGPYPATVHKLLTYWYPSKSLQEKFKNDNDKLLIFIMNSLHIHCDLKDNELRPCHQLDYATSGVLCVARTKPAAAKVSQLFEHRDSNVSKSYLAILHGHLSMSSLDYSSLPTLTSQELQTSLRYMEQTYRTKRKQAHGSKKQQQKQQQQSSTQSSTLKKTFQGYQPPYALFVKWRNLATNNTSNKKRKRAPQILLTQSDWDYIFGPVAHIQPNEVPRDWKSLSSAQMDVFSIVADRHNELYLRRQNEQQQQDTEKTNQSTTPKLLPTLFRVRDCNNDDNDTNNNCTTVYLNASIAQVPNSFAMMLDPNTAEPIVNRQWTTTSSIDSTLQQQQQQQQELDFKPSVTKCTILQCGTFSKSKVPITKVELTPLTGRRHQLRIHVASILGHGILGDVTYDATTSSSSSKYASLSSTTATVTNRQVDVPRMCLHAHRLQLPILEHDNRTISTFVASDPFLISDNNNELMIEVLPSYRDE